MKKIKSNYSTLIAEYLKHFVFSLGVLMTGLFIPASLVFGITFNRPLQNEERKATIYQQDNIISGQTISWPLQNLSDKSS
jgi:hypothetical protein